jgi:hypothetical protein
MNNPYMAVRTEPIERVADIEPKMIGYGFTAPRWSWLSRLILWIASRWFKPIYEERKMLVTYKQIEVQYDRFALLCRDQMEYFMQRFGHRPRYIVMGPKQFFGVCEEFIADYPMAIRPNEFTPQCFMGMDIYMLPNFDGVLLLPDFKELR